MTEPASDELIEHIKASRTPPTSVEIAALIARIRQQDSEIERLHRGDEKRVRHISQLIIERDEARDEIVRLRAALAEYVCECTGQCHADLYGGPCGRRAYAALKGGEA